MISGAAIYFGSRWQNNSNPSNQESATNASESGKLKTYSNQSLGFSFSYPEELTYINDLLWKFTEKDQSGTLILQNYIGYKGRQIEDTDFQLILLVKKSQGVPLEQYPQEAQKALGTMQISTIEVGGVKAIEASGGEKIKAVPTVWLINKDVLYVFQLSEPTSLNAKWFDQILSSFKFSN